MLCFKQNTKEPIIFKTPYFADSFCFFLFFFLLTTRTTTIHICSLQFVSDSRPSLETPRGRGTLPPVFFFFLHLARSGGGSKKPLPALYLINCVGEGYFWVVSRFELFFAAVSLSRTRRRGFYFRNRLICKNSQLPVLALRIFFFQGPELHRIRGLPFFFVFNNKNHKKPNDLYPLHSICVRLREDAGPLGFYTFSPGGFSTF